jgi:hypothetical protein
MRHPLPLSIGSGASTLRIKKSAFELALNDDLARF